MTAPLFDDVAERAVAGIAVGSGSAANAVLNVCSPADFRDPTLGRVVALAAALDDHDLPAPADDVHLVDERRSDAIADELDRSRTFVRRLLAGRPCLTDATGAWARRVRAAADARREAQALVEQLEQLGVDVTIDVRGAA